MREYRKTHLLAAAVVGLATLLGGAQAARAGFTVTLNSVVPSGSEFVFNYGVSIADDDVLTAGNFFRIYDFFGYVPGSITAPAGWTATTMLSNPTPPPDVIIGLGDDPAVPNLIFTYTGASVTGPITLTGFSARSTFGPSRLKNFAGRTTASAAGGAPVDSVGTVGVPVPEPASLISTGLGVLTLGAVFGLRRRRSEA